MTFKSIYLLCISHLAKRVRQLCLCLLVGERFDALVIVTLEQVSVTILSLENTGRDGRHAGQSLEVQTILTPSVPTPVIKLAISHAHSFFILFFPRVRGSLY